MLGLISGICNAASSTTSSHGDGVDDITAGISKLPASVAAAGAGAAAEEPTHQEYTLNRFAKGRYRVQYTHNVTREAFSFPLERPSVVERVARVWEACKRDTKYNNHMYAGAVILYETAAGSEKQVKYRPFTTELLGDLLPDRPGEEDLSLPVDWISGGSGSEHTETLYRRRSSGHSESGWIEDYKALWVTNADAIVRRFMPPKGIKKMLMSGIELDSSFDVCDPCLTNLEAFREDSTGQQGLSQAIRDTLTRKGILFAPDHPEDFSLLFYHSQRPYINDTTYHALSLSTNKYVVAGLKYAYSGWSYGDTTYNRLEPNVASRAYKVCDKLSQCKDTPLTANVIYGHIHALTGKDMGYADTAAHKGFMV